MDTSHENGFEFVDEVIDDEYMCGICHSVMIKPVCCRDGHCWCESCIRQWLKNNNTCPMGREALSVQQLSNLRPIERVSAYSNDVMHLQTTCVSMFWL
jgi:hypothetical protein